MSRAPGAHSPDAACRSAAHRARPRFALAEDPALQWLEVFASHDLTLPRLQLLAEDQQGRLPAKGFADLDATRTWAAEFVGWYNDEHRHSGIRYVTPVQRHCGADDTILAARHWLYLQARERKRIAEVEELNRHGRCVAAAVWREAGARNVLATSSAEWRHRRVHGS